MTLGRALSWTAERFPEAPVIVGERSYSYGEWDARTNRLARALRSLGATRGERVAVTMANGERLAATHLACQKLGVYSTPLNTRYATDELAYCLGDAEPRVVLSDDATGEAVTGALERLGEAGSSFEHVHAGEDVPPGAREFEALLGSETDAGLDVAVREDDPSVMLYTAGTTGRPKGVPRTHRNEHSAALAHVVQARYEPGDSTLGAMPMYHTMGLRSLLSMILIGGRLALLPAFEAGSALELIESERLSTLYLVPTAFWALAAHGGLEDGGRSVRKLAFAGAAMTSSLCEELERTLAPEVFINHYGSTEVYTFAIEADAARRPGSAGRPGINSRMRVVRADADGSAGPDEVVGRGEVGELIASLGSPEAFSGYWHRPEADGRALRDGWYFTGDLGYVDDEGMYRVAGRVDDMIITGGENVHPLEVEDALGRSADVADIAVAGIAEEKWGQAVTAFVVAREGGDPDGTARRLAAWVREESGLTAYKRPKRIIVLDEIPKSPVGKILRRKLQAGEYEPLAEAGAARDGASG